jgi:hypothetical protein
LTNKPDTTMKGILKTLLQVCVTMLLVGSVSAVFAQDKRWEEGEIESVEIEIVKERQITLPPANRNFEKIPPKPSEPIRAPFQYEFRPFSFQTSQINPPIRPLRLKQEESKELFGGYVSAGFGNYVTPYLEGFVNTKRDKNKLVGAHAYLNTSDKGPVDGVNSGGGNTGFSVFGRTFNEQVSLGAEAAYENRSTHFYGYEPGADVDGKDIKQAYNLFRLSGDISNSKNADFSYKLGAAFSYLSDKYKARESEVDFTFNSGYKLSEESSIGIKADYAIISRTDEFIEAKPRSLFTVNPSFVFYPVENLKMSAGIVAAFENDSIDNRDVHAYPDIHVSYPLSPSVDVVASLTGGIEKVSLQSMSKENLWLAPNIPVFHTNKLYDLQAALHTRVGSKVALNGGFSFASLKNWYFYVNNDEVNDPILDQAKFTPEYEDGATLRTNFFASIGFAQTESVRILLRGDLYQYNRKGGEEVWHRPTYKVTGDMSFNIYKKVLLNVNLISQGGMKAKVPDTSDEVVELDPAFDLNARLEYLVSKRVSVFGQFNNITSNEYQIFLNYPVRGFQFLGGLTYSF